MKNSEFADDATVTGLGSKTVTPSDTDDIWPGEVARSLVVFGAGDVSFIGWDGVTDTWTLASDAGFPYTISIAVKRVLSTGTTVTDDIKAIR